MTKIQQEVESTEFSSTVGGGAVEVVVNGAHEVTAVNLKPEVVDPEDIELLEDLIMAAINDGYAKADKVYEEKMGKFGGMGGLGGLL